MFSIRYLFYDFVRITAAIPGLICFRPKLVYENKKAKKRIRGGAMIVSNHVGFRDPVYLQFAVWYRRQHFVCLKKLFEGRAALLFKGFLCIPIDREDMSMNSLREIVSELKAGHVVSMFPEGHISEDENKQMGSFKSGMVLMAMQGKSPIIPIYIKPKEHFYSRVVMAIGEPVDVCSILGNRPSLSAIDGVSAIIKEKEEKLKELV